MELTQEELVARLNSKDNLINVMRDNPDHNIKVVKWAGSHSGRSKDDNNLTEDERTAAGVLSRTVGNEIASQVLGISKQTASNISNGNGSVTPEQVALVDAAMNRVSKTVEEVAAEKLLIALGMITEDKLSTCSAKDLSTVASNMARTVQNMRVDTSEKGKNVKVSIILQQPKPSREEHFEMIEVSA